MYTLYVDIVWLLWSLCVGYAARVNKGRRTSRQKRRGSERCVCVWVHACVYVGVSVCVCVGVSVYMHVLDTCTESTPPPL